MAGGGKNPAPSGQTTQTSTQQPWSVQQPYLENAFAGAQQLYGRGGPQYYPNATYAPPVSAQIGGLNDLWSTGATLGAESNIPLSLMNSVLSGQFMQGNPAIGLLNHLGMQNYGQNNLGTPALAQLASGQTGYDTQTPYGGLTYLGGQNAAGLNPAFGSLAQIANQGAGGNFRNASDILNYFGNTNAATQNPAFGALSQIASQGAGGGFGGASDALSRVAGRGGTGISQNIGGLQRIAGPGGTGLSKSLGALGSYASGSQINPYLDQLSKTTLAGVLPDIQKQFIEGGSLSSPQAAYASSQGASAALAPVLNQAFQQEQQNQINAANMAGNLRLGRGQLQTQAEQAAANARLGRAGVQNQAAGLLGNLALGGGQLQTQAANALGNQYLTGTGQQQQAASLLGNLGLGNVAAQTQAGSALGNQLLQGAGQQSSALSNALSAATGLGGLQQTAGANLGNLALGGQNAQTNTLNALANAYGTSVDQITKTLALYPQTAQGALIGPQAQIAAGGQQQALNQQAINDAIQRWNYGQTQPYQNLSQFLGNISGNYGGTLTQKNPYYLNQGANLLSSGMGGAALGSTIGGLFPEAIGSGLGAAGGAGLGALLAFI